MPATKTRAGPLGLHFFSRSTGINVLIEEISIQADKWSTAPRFVSIALTNACDLECGYCYAPKHRAHLSPQSIIRWARQLDEHGCFGVGFGGGEPTLFPQLVQLCSDLNDETTLAITMTTHGHWAKDDLPDRLSGLIHFVRVSMDGVHATYERLRGRPFASFLSHLARIKTVAPFGINYVVNDETIDDLPRAAELAVNQGAAEFLLLPEVSNGRLSYQSEFLARWIDDNYSRYPLAISVAGVGSMDFPALPISDPRGPTFDFLHIDADAQLKTCAFASTGIPLPEQSNIMDSISILRKHSSLSER